MWPFKEKKQVDEPKPPRNDMTIDDVITVLKSQKSGFAPNSDAIQSLLNLMGSDVKIKNRGEGEPGTPSLPVIALCVALLFKQSQQESTTK